MSLATICIIDDQEEYLDMIDNIIMNHLSDCYIIKLTGYDSKQINNSIIDLFILDIDMKGINGIDLAMLLKNTYPYVDIVFVSAHNHFIHNSLMVRPLYFIRKDHLIEDFSVLFKLLDFNIYQQKMNLIDIQKRNRCFQINSIAYVEIMSHELTVHLNQKEYSFFITLKEFLEKANVSYIVQIHKSYLVNLNKIKYIEGNICYMSDHVALPIGRKYKNNFIELYRSQL